MCAIAPGECWAEGAKGGDATLRTLRQGDGEERAVGVLLVDDVDERAHHIGVLCRDVVVLVEVDAQVVKARFASLNDHFPIALTHADHIRFVKLPVEKIVLGLRFFASTKGGVEGDAVEAVVFVTLVGCGEVVDAGNFAESGEEIIESKLMVADTTGGYLTRPTHDEGNADSPFVGGALDAAQQAVAIEEGRVGTALFVRAIVGGEDDHRVFIQPFGFETVEDFADHHIQARDHGGKLGVSFEGGVVA